MNIRNPSYTRITNIPEYVYEEAELRAKNQRVFKKSHRKDEANGVGCLGEIIAEYWMKYNSIPFTSELEKTTHDYVLANNLTVDVKAKDRTVKPSSNFDNSAPVYNHVHQKPNYFLFVSLERNKNDKSKDLRRFHRAYVVGSIRYEEMDRIGLRFLEGEKDWRNKTEFWTDCLNVEMWQLVPIKETIEIFKGHRQSPSNDADLNIPVIKEMNRRISIGEYKPRPLPCIDTVPVATT